MRFCGIFVSLLIQALPVMGGLLDEANAKFDATLYREAIPLYQKLLKNETGDQEEVLRHLGQALLFSNRNEEAAEIFRRLNRGDSNYWLGIAYKKQGRYQEAIDEWQAYLSRAADLPHERNAKLEIGIAAVHCGQLQLAKYYLSQVEQSALAQVYLARASLKEGNPKQAEQILGCISYSNAAAYDPLHYEIAYLRGKVSFQLGDYFQAVYHFERALPKRRCDQAPWYVETLYHLGWSYLKAADSPLRKRGHQIEYFDKAEDMFHRLLDISSEERIYLSLAQCYLTKAVRLKDPAAYQKVELLLSQKNIFVSQEGRMYALLLRAEACSDHVQRQKLYHRVISENDKDHPTELILKCQAHAFYGQGTREGRLQALSILNALMAMNTEKPNELLYLHSLVAASLALEDEDVHFYDIATHALERRIANFPEGVDFAKMLNLLGVLSYKKGNTVRAEKYFVKLADQVSDSSIAGDALFWASRCADAQGELGKAKAYRRRVWEEYPHSQYAPEAYFFTHTYREYLQGDRSAMKHLNAFKKHYPDTPYLVNALYLIGLDYKRDRKTPEGKWIRKKNLAAAIEAFQELESLYISLSSDDQVLRDIRLRAILEQALAHLAIAEESQGAKRQIYLEYAENILRGVEEPSLLDESAYWLAKVLIKAGRDEQAERVLAEMLEKRQSGEASHGYFFGKAWYEKGCIALRREEYAQALQYLAYAEEGNGLGIDERLDLWIQRSHCYRGLNQMDDAMLILSKVINYDAVSSLRLKAMYLRAEIYALQQRHELARKQLEALAKKGGEWGHQATVKLEQEYGYD